MTNQLVKWLFFAIQFRWTHLCLKTVGSFCCLWTTVSNSYDHCFGLNLLMLSDALLFSWPLFKACSKECGGKGYKFILKDKWLIWLTITHCSWIFYFNGNTSFNQKYSNVTLKVPVWHQSVFERQGVFLDTKGLYDATKITSHKPLPIFPIGLDMRSSFSNSFTSRYLFLESLLIPHQHKPYSWNQNT